MAVAVVTVAGRAYRVGCEQGDEPRIEALGKLVDARIDKLRQGFGEIGDQRLLVMGALEFADEAEDHRLRAEALQKEVEALRAEIATRDAREAALEARLAQSVTEAADRLDQLARDLARRGAAALS
jgi:cell division protein ZapA